MKNKKSESLNGNCSLSHSEKGKKTELVSDAQEHPSGNSLTSGEQGERTPPSKKPKKNQKKLSNATKWTIKITIITLFLSFIVSFINEITSSKSNVTISVLLLSLLISVAIVFDAVGVAATSCDIAPLLSMAAKKVKGASIAVKLVKNAEKVSNICNDVVGDMSGIISGACAAAIVLKFAADNPQMYLFNIVMSSIVSAVTVGGKAFCKSIALKNSKEMILFASRVLGIFYHPKKK